TPPRDALISLSSTAETQGRAFGVHRAMDTTGALLGPLLAFAILWTAAESYDAVFVTSFCFAALGVLVLVLFVRESPKVTSAVRVRLTAVVGEQGFIRVCGCAGLLGMVTVSDAFLYL